MCVMRWFVLSVIYYNDFNDLSQENYDTFFVLLNKCLELLPSSNPDRIKFFYTRLFPLTTSEKIIPFTAYCLLPTAYCLLPTAYCLLPTAYCLLPTAYCLLPTAYCLLPTAYCLLPTAYCLLPTAYCLLPTAYCLLPTAYCLLPTAYCLLPTAYCLLPTPTALMSSIPKSFQQTAVAHYNNC